MRNATAADYAEMYLHGYMAKKHPPCWWDHIGKVVELMPATILDVGCGPKAEFLHWMLRHTRCTRGVGVDPACKYFRAPDRSDLPSTIPIGAKHICSGLEAPHGDIIGAIDYVTAFDVLEHIPPDDVAVCLREMTRMARHGLVLSLANMSDPWTLPSGEAIELHLVREGPDWWSEQIGRAIAGRGWGMRLLPLPYPERWWVLAGAGV